MQIPRAQTDRGAFWRGRSSGDVSRDSRTPNRHNESLQAGHPCVSAPIPSADSRAPALFLLGPAVVASIAYVDPGNFATDFQAGARFGYLLISVVLGANITAMVVQHLSAKLGATTGASLPQLCRQHYSRRATLLLWLQAELMAIATDIAEVVGGAIGLTLLFNISMARSGLIIGVTAFAVLALQARGYRYFECAIALTLVVIVAGFAYETARVRPSVTGSLRGLVPAFHGSSSMALAAGIVGATIMPHTIYLHSAMTRYRDGYGVAPARRRARLRSTEVLIALGVAGLVNLAMLAVAARLLHERGHDQISTLFQVHSGFAVELGGGAAFAFSLALLASGVSSSSVGTYAGQVVMEGFLRRNIPLFARRLVTLLPALALLIAGVNPTELLILSQIVLSFGIPFALIPLIGFTRREDLMLHHVNWRLTTAAASLIALAVIALNCALLLSELHLG